MNAEALKRRIAGKISIPSMPEIVRRIDRLLADPDVGMREVGRLIAQDPPLAARLLRVANSSYYGLQSPVESAEHAASILGMTAMRSLLMQVSVFETFEHIGARGFDLRRLWKHSILVGRLAVSIADRSPIVSRFSADALYVAGLLHDIGQLVLFDTVPGLFLETVEEAKRTGRARHLIEIDKFGLGHAQVGALIARRWRLPEGVDGLIFAHHDTAGLGTQDSNVATLVVADELSHAVLDREIARIKGSVDPKTLRMIDIPTDDLVALGVEVAEGLDDLDF